MKLKYIIRNMLVCSAACMLMLGLCGCEDGIFPSDGDYDYLDKGSNYQDNTPKEDDRGEQETVEIQDGAYYYLVQCYSYPTEETEAEREYEIVALSFDRGSSMAYMYPYDDLSEPDAAFTYIGSSLYPYMGGDENNDFSLQIALSGVIKGPVTAGGINMYMRFTPLSLTEDGGWCCVETGETFDFDREDQLVDNSKVDSNFMSDVRDYAARFGISMTGGTSANNDGNDNDGGYQQPDNQLTEEMLNYYIQVEGQRHIQEYVEWEKDPFGFTPADHMQIPSNQRGITQSEFERLADEYAQKNGPSGYVPIETWRD